MQNLIAQMLKFIALLAILCVISVKAQKDSVCETANDCTNTTDYFCKFPDGLCGSSKGLCKTLPFVCNKIYNPVCGCDSQTYSNDCMMKSAGVSLLYRGQCKHDSSNNCKSSNDCLESMFCAYPADNCGGVGMCVARPTQEQCPPVNNTDLACGCDGMLYTSPCVAAALGNVTTQDPSNCKSETIQCANTTDCLPYDPSYVCLKSNGQCSASSLGVCTIAPEMCPMIYSPVCGCDGRTYSNYCYAQSAGQTIQYPGSCLEVVEEYLI